MTTRIHIPIDEADKVRYRRQAEREGLSLAAWLREAAEARLAAAEEAPRLDSREELERFFAACDAREVEEEPDWEEHRKVIESSMGPGRDAP